MSPLCSRNARLEKALVGRAQWGIHPGHPRIILTSKLGSAIVVHSLRPCWTPCLSILQACHNSRADAGVMISASHREAAHVAGLARFAFTSRALPGLS